MNATSNVWQKTAAAVAGLLEMLSDHVICSSTVTAWHPPLDPAVAAGPELVTEATVEHTRRFITLCLAVRRYGRYCNPATELSASRTCLGYINRTLAVRIGERQEPSARGTEDDVVFSMPTLSAHSHGRSKTNFSFTCFKAPAGTTAEKTVTSSTVVLVLVNHAVLPNSQTTSASL